MTGTEETFELWVEGGGTAYYPQLFLVMTETCWDGLTKVEIDFHDDGPPVDATIFPDDFIEKTDDDKWLPPSYPEGIRYTVASLKDHLGIGGTDESIYWTLVTFPTDDTITSNIYYVKITLDSTDPKMMVYVFGKTVDSTDAPYDMKVPPTNPGFMVPEPATIVAVATSLIALIGYTTLKNKNLL